MKNAAQSARVESGCRDVSNAKRIIWKGSWRRSLHPPYRETGQPDGELYEAVIEALKEIYDPEIPVNIYDLGLIYNVEINNGHALVVDDTDHAALPGCRVDARRS